MIAQALGVLALEARNNTPAGAPDQYHRREKQGGSASASFCSHFCQLPEKLRTRPTPV